MNKNDIKCLAKKESLIDFDMNLKLSKRDGVCMDILDWFNKKEPPLKTSEVVDILRDLEFFVRYNRFFREDKSCLDVLDIISKDETINHEVVEVLRDCEWWLKTFSFNASAYEIIDKEGKKNGAFVKIKGKNKFIKVINYLEQTNYSEKQKRDLVQKKIDDLTNNGKNLAIISDIKVDGLNKKEVEQAIALMVYYGWIYEPEHNKIGLVK